MVVRWGGSEMGWRNVVVRWSGEMGWRNVVVRWGGSEMEW